MTALLIFGLALIFLPIIGFLTAGSIMLYACLKDDGGDKIFPGITASIVSGIVVVIIWGVLEYVV
jgi:hypothetical protein